MFKPLFLIQKLTGQMANVFCRVWGSVDDSHAGRDDAEEQGDRNASYGGDVQLLDEEGPLVVEDVDDVHVEVALTEAVVQVLAAFEQAEEDVAGGLVARLAHGVRLDPVIGPEAA